MIKKNKKIITQTAKESDTGDLSQSRLYLRTKMEMAMRCQRSMSLCTCGSLSQWERLFLSPLPLTGRKHKERGRERLLAVAGDSGARARGA